MTAFGIISDTHNHGWSAFATTTPAGTNSRLEITLAETRRAAQAVRDAGGYVLYHGGDLFHVRGSLAPSVLNPTVACYREEIERGMRIVINAGNHDLEGKEAEEVSSAITALKDIGCWVMNKPDIHRGGGSDMAIVPWIPNVAELLKAIKGLVPSAARKDLDLLIHAPIDGVISGLPDHGLTAKILAGLGFRRVFAGHYHHHLDFGNGVYSIGALTHQTWSDVGSRAGFLIVTDQGVKWHQSQAPRFIELCGLESDGDLRALATGNYVKARVGDLKQAEIEELRSFLMAAGAAGVIIMCEKSASTVTRNGASYKAGTTIEQSIGAFIGSKGEQFTRPKELAQRCGELLTRVRSVA